MTFADKVKVDESDSESKQPDNRPYRKVKHMFEIQVKELKNIPILDKLIKDISSIENSKFQHSRQPLKKDSKNKYIQSVAVKYAFPLDEDEIF